MTHFVYIMASRPGGALYIGRTNGLRRRLEAQRAGLSAHTAKYKIKTLVWFEAHADFEASLRRERSIKRWRRSWKDQLIMEMNPGWRNISGLVPDED
ncbi:MAG: GIY-YIG nuclease family protein [Boseongicola sp.]|nr:MAG: GIY-YIG nuclease family protein [Boseongicola sp.]